MMKLQVLGPGCPKCKMLAEQTETAAKELGIEGAKIGASGARLGLEAQLVWLDGQKRPLAALVTIVLLPSL